MISTARASDLKSSPAAGSYLYKTNPIQNQLPCLITLCHCLLQLYSKYTHWYPDDQINYWVFLIELEKINFKFSTKFSLALQTATGYLSSKEPACQCRRHGFDPWVGKIPWRRKWQPTPIFLPGKSHGQRILAGYSPWGSQKESWTRLSN